MWLGVEGREGGGDLDRNTSRLSVMLPVGMMRLAHMNAVTTIRRFVIRSINNTYWSGEDYVLAFPGGVAWWWWWWW